METWSPQITTSTCLLDMVAYSIFLLPILLFVGQAIGAPPSYTAACKAVEVAIGKSNVFYQGEPFSIYIQSFRY